MLRIRRSLEELLILGTSVLAIGFVSCEKKDSGNVETNIEQNQSQQQMHTGIQDYTEKYDGNDIDLNDFKSEIEYHSADGKVKVLSGMSNQNESSYNHPELGIIDRLADLSYIILIYEADPDFKKMMETKANRLRKFMVEKNLRFHPKQLESLALVNRSYEKITGTSLGSWDKFYPEGSLSHRESVSNQTTQSSTNDPNYYKSIEQFRRDPRFNASDLEYTEMVENKIREFRDMASKVRTLEDANNVENEISYFSRRHSFKSYQGDALHVIEEFVRERQKEIRMGYSKPDYSSHKERRLALEELVKKHMGNVYSNSKSDYEGDVLPGSDLMSTMNNQIILFNVGAHYRNVYGVNVGITEVSGGVITDDSLYRPSISYRIYLDIPGVYSEEHFDFLDVTEYLTFEHSEGPKIIRIFAKNLRYEETFRIPDFGN